MCPLRYVSASLCVRFAMCPLRYVSLLCILSASLCVRCFACAMSVLSQCRDNAPQSVLATFLYLDYFVTIYGHTFTRVIRSRGCADRRHPKRRQKCERIERSVLIGRRLDGASRDRYAYCKSCEHLWCEVCIEYREQRE